MVNNADCGREVTAGRDLSHALRVQDRAIRQYFLSEPPLWEQGVWARRIGVSMDLVGTGVPVGQMELIRFADLDAWRVYQSAVIAATDQVLDDLGEETLREIVIAAVLTDWEGFTPLMVGVGNPIRKLDVLEGWVYQHGLRHLGELEHARSLVGLGGLAA